MYVATFEGVSVIDAFKFLPHNHAPKGRLETPDARSCDDGMTVIVTCATSLI